MSRPRRAWVLAAIVVLGLLALAAAAVFVGRDTGLVELPGTTPLLFIDPSPARLDTVTIDGRRVTATLGGIVRQIDPDGTVWMEWDGDAFGLRLPETDSVQVEDRALVVGRLRSWRGRRWLDVEAWTPITRSIR